jgi:hypothetical protein
VVGTTHPLSRARVLSPHSSFAVLPPPSTTAPPCAAAALPHLVAAACNASRSRLEGFVEVMWIGKAWWACGSVSMHPTTFPLTSLCNVHEGGMDGGTEGPVSVSARISPTVCSSHSLSPRPHLPSPPCLALTPDYVWPPPLRPLVFAQISHARSHTIPHVLDPTRPAVRAHSRLRTTTSTPSSRLRTDLTRTIPHEPTRPRSLTSTSATVRTELSPHAPTHTPRTHATPTQQQRVVFVRVVYNAPGLRPESRFVYISRGSTAEGVECARGL